MSKKDLGKHFDDLSEDAKVYIKSEVEYYKLDAYRKLIKSTSFMLRFIVKVGVIVILLSFFSIALALFIGEQFQHNYMGFLIIAGIYLIVFILLSIFGKAVINKWVLIIFNSIFKDV